MGTLNEIYAKHGTDKGNKINKHGDVHYYGDFYEMFFNKYKGRHINMLEIGVQDGYSMLAHDEYFEGNADIYGIDIILDNVEINPEEHPNMHLVLGSSTDPMVYSKLANEKFDIIIDDGSHFHEDMVKNLSMYSRLLTDDGIYIVEDLHCDFDTFFNDSANGELLTNLLLRHVHSNLLSYEENTELLNSIEQVYVYEYVNNAEIVFSEPCSGSSITAIVKFKKK